MYYKSAVVVLNDHWESMRENEFVSNRLFDCLACGCSVVSDKNDGIYGLFGDNVYQYDGTPEDLRFKVDMAIKKKNDSSRIRDLQKLADEVAEIHSFDQRAREISKFIK